MLFRSLFSRRQPAPKVNVVMDTSFTELDLKLRSADTVTNRLRQAANQAAGLSTAVIDGLSNLKLVASFMDGAELNHSALITVNSTGNIISAQYNTERLFGRSIEDLLGESLFSYIAPEYKKFYISQFSKLTDESNLRVIEYSIVKESGEEVYVEERTNILTTDSTVVYQKILKDITNLRLGVNYELPEQKFKQFDLVLDKDFRVFEVSGDMNPDLFMFNDISICPLFVMNSKFWNKFKSGITSGKVSDVLIKCRMQNEITYFTCNLIKSSDTYTLRFKLVPIDVSTWASLRHDVLFSISEISNRLINNSLDVALPDILGSLKSSTKASFVSMSKYTNSYHLNLPQIVKSEDSDLIEFEPEELDLLHRGNLIIRTNLEFKPPTSSILLNNKMDIVVLVPILIKGKLWGTLNLFYNQNYPSIVTLKYLESLSTVLASAVKRDKNSSGLKILNLAFDSLFTESPLPMLFVHSDVILGINKSARALLEVDDLSDQILQDVLPGLDATSDIVHYKNKLLRTTTAEVTHAGEVYTQIVLTDLTPQNTSQYYIDALTAAVDHIEDMVVVTDNNFDVIYANKKASDLVTSKSLRDSGIISEVLDEILIDLKSKSSTIKIIDRNPDPIKLCITKIAGLDIDPMFYIIIGRLL